MRRRERMANATTDLTRGRNVHVMRATHAAQTTASAAIRRAEPQCMTKLLSLVLVSSSPRTDPPWPFRLPCKSPFFWSCGLSGSGGRRERKRADSNDRKLSPTHLCPRPFWEGREGDGETGGRKLASETTRTSRICWSLAVVVVSSSWFLHALV